MQLNGAYVHFADTHPEKVNGRVMVPFRAIAGALGAEVDYNAGAITAKKNGQTLAFSLGGKQLTATDSVGKTVKTVQLDTAPYKKADAPMFRCAFCRSIRTDRAVGSGYADRRAV